uniref:Amino acid adenylation domain-containing protein n=1 Tax=Candidatus Kentrum sp. FW TaxID=2126338 RepID=A0A450SL54_9GAMM|nr:MAG: amino acid adenylation domain-containing protein [Candidatus Kentron sp. FW]
MSIHDSAISLLAELKDIGCRVWVEDGELRVRAPKAGITEELKEQLKANREEILAHLDSLQAQDTRLADGIPVLPPGSPLVMSHAQQRLWFLAQLEGASVTYNMPAALKLSGPLDVTILRRTFRTLLERHQTLRLCFPTVDGEGAVREIPIYDPLTVTDFSHLPEAQQQTEIQQQLQTHATRPFDLAEGKLLRLHLFILNSREHVLLFDMHHIISDGWSMGVLVREWVEIYSALLQGRSPDLVPLPIQYSDYAAWQRDWLQGDVLQRQLDYWTEQLAGVPELLALPTDFPRPAMQNYRGNHLQTRIVPELTKHLDEFGRQQSSTLFMVLLAAFNMLLARYSGQDDVCVGSPIANRTHPDTENLIGFFVNTLVLRTRLNPNQSFRELLQQVRQTCLEAYAHQDIPFETLVEQRSPTRTLSHSPLFQVMLALQNNDPVEMELPELTMTALEQDYPIAKFDLTLNIEEQDGQLHCIWEYATSLFTEDTIRRMGRHFEVLLRGIVENPELLISQLPLLTEAERHRILVEWNDTGAPYPQEQCVHELFEEQAAKTPDAVAVVFEDEEVSYGELNERANRLAHRLRGLDVGPEVLVGLFLERSVEMVVGILAILKAGGAYVPLDPEYPQERLAFMAEDADLKVLLCHGATKERAPECAAYILDMDAEAAAIAGESPANPAWLAGPGNLAYVIYTSGSTGKPKGVCVEHGNVVRLFRATGEVYHFDASDVWTMFHSHAFDFSVWEIWGALLYGGTLVVVPYMTTRTPALFYELLIEKGVTVLNQTPSAFYQLIQHEETLSPNSDKSLALRWVIFGGEALNPTKLEPWFERHGDKEPTLINMYGITETTVHVTWHSLESGEAEDASSNIGIPIPDLRAYILDSWQQPVPIGIAGELYVGGAGVARGYLNRPDLTAERFTPDPFSIDTVGDGAGARLYRTGDLCRWLPDGNIEYLGRIDTQVKIRGFRIESGEVENALLAHPDVREAVVDARGEEDKRLVSWIVTDSDDHSALRDSLWTHLHDGLPDWMVPAGFVFVEALPLTPSGKVDHKALPDPDANEFDAGEKYVAPRTSTEKALAEVFADVLGHEIVGIHDNFFRLGGDSILSIRIIAKARQAGYALSVQDIFRSPTVAQLARGLEGKSGQLDFEPISTPFSLIAESDRVHLPTDVEDAYPLSALQAGMLFHSQYETDSTVYHNVNSYYLRAHYDERALEDAVRHLGESHPILRASFHFRDLNEPLQCVHYQVQIPFVVQDISHLSSDEQEVVIDEWIAAEKRQKFVWECAPLLRISIHRRGNDTFNLTLTEHHAILDGWSVASLITELLQDYLRRIDDLPTLESVPLSLQYRDFIALEREAIASETTQAFWQQQIEGMSFAHMPRLPETHRTVGTGNRYEVSVPPALSGAIKQLAETLEVPIKTILLAAHLRVIGLFSGQTDVVTGLVSNGRPEGEDGEKIIGLFLNTLPFRLQLGPDESWTQLIRSTFQKEQAILAHRRYPLSEMQKTRQGKSLFETAFNFVHFHVYREITEVDRVKALGFKGFEQTNFALTGNFSLDLGTGDVQIDLNYDPDELGLNQIESMAHCYLQVFAMMTEQPATVFGNSPLLHPDEIEQLRSWNETEAPYPTDKCVHELFEEQAAKTPDAVAVVFENEEISYGELNARANRLAHRLRKLGIGPEVLVGLFVERSVEMVAGLLAILKAGGAYVPLDPEYPVERLAFMAEDADLKVLLCHGATRERLPECAARILDMDAEAEAIAGESFGNPAQLAGPDNLAYVIYTSGSTGKPKGVMVEHKSVGNLIAWHCENFAITPEDRCTQVASLSFDAAVWEIWPVLITGGALYVVPSRRIIAADASAIKDWMLSREITVGFLPTPLAQTVVSEKWPISGQLRFLLTGGDQFKFPISGDLPFQVINNYGPTENTVVTTSGVIEPETSLPPIGRPISNTRTYILNERMSPVPIGVAGELHIGGAGVARGYLNRPDLTFDKFIPDPFSDEPEARLYRTGDLCRWLPDGNIEFLGRIDTQVKIRGFRIECGEVENALLSHPDVREAVVDARGEGAEKQLVAWVVGTDDTVRATDVGATGRSPVQGGRSPVRDELRTYLRGMLPDWMVPSAFVFVDTLPLTPSGKIDRRALSAPEASDSPGTEYIPPISPTEELLAQLWAVVLKRESIGRFDNFFDLGGHSLLATQLISRIRDGFDVELPVRTVFEHPELSALAEAISSSRQGMPGPSARDGNKQTLPPIEPQPVDAPKALSFAQQRLWFLERFETDGTAAYNIPAALRLEGALDIHALQSSLHWMVERHESLRMAFPEQGGEAGVVVLSAADFEFPIHDLCHLSSVESDLQQRIDEHAARPFDLARGPLFRAEILRLAEEAPEKDKQAEDGQAVHVLLINMHHIISDGWSMGVFVREWRLAYIALAGGHRPTLAPLPIQYGDYANWQRQWLQGGILERQSDYWREALEGSPERLELPTDYPRPAQQSYRGAHHLQVLPLDVTAAIKDLSRTQGVTLFMTLLAAFDVLLARYSGQDDICVGSPIANRTHTHTENLIGFFVNTLVLRTRLNPEQGFRDLLQQVRQTCLGAYAHQDIPFETLVEQLNPARSLSHSPLFQVMLVLQNNAQAEMEWPGLTITGLEQDYPIAKFDLTLDIVEQDGRLYCAWEYATLLFTENTIRRMGEHFEVLLRGIVAEPETPVAQLPLLTEAERRQVLVEWNDTKAPYPQDKCVHELFEAQAAKTPDAVAVIFEDKEISYGELNARANRLAHRLRKLGVGPEVLVGLFVARSADMVVGLLAILKAGGAYVPLDPEYPVDRLAFMAGDADLKVLLCHGATKERLPECAARILELDGKAQVIAGENSENPERLAGPNNLAYVIYTSGSTGKPKGVCIEHRNVVNLIAWHGENFSITSEDHCTQIASLSFDAAVWEIWPVLAKGATLYVVPPRTITSDPSSIKDWIIYHGITKCFLPTPLAQAIISENWHSSAALRFLLTGGDQFRSPIPAQLPFQVVNNYGPTENTVVTTSGIVEPGRPLPPIGDPISNTRCYILDPHMNLVPTGVGGELYIGGAGVVRGYLNRPDLTVEKFIPDPFSDDLDARLYRTGDLCRWLPDGNIEFLGRMDTQVKIRGFRIECGEVENALLSHPDVREAVVDAHGEGEDKQLVAWVGVAHGNDLDDVGATGRSPLRDELRTHLRGMLPDWMVPSVFVFLDTLPLTPSGKIDRRALPDPGGDGFISSHEYTAPRNPTEEMLCGIFAETLGVPRAGIHDDFFDLGGHSLLVVRVLSSIRKKFQVEIPLRALFQHPTPQGLAGTIRAREEWKPTILLPLKSGASGVAPLFCVHPVGGGAFCYRELADSLGAGRSVYGIQAVGFEGEAEPLTDVEAMAARYVAEITARWPKGPYNLYGWSLGGVIAFEMARQLRAADREIELLVLADTVCPHPDEKQEEPEDEEILLHLLAEAGEVEPAFFHEIQNAAPADRQTLLRQRLAKGSNSLDPGDVDRFVRIFRANLEGLSAYRPFPWEGKIVFLSARERIGGGEESLESGWRRFAWEIAHHTVSGNHFTMHRQPNVQEITKILDPLRL